MRLRVCSEFPKVTPVWRAAIALLAGCLSTAMPAAAQSAVGVATTINAATHDQVHTWSIAKTGSSVSGFAGDILPGGTWVINVSESAAPANFSVSGVIALTNPTDAAVDLTVSGAANDGTAAVMKCDGGASVSIPAGRNTGCRFVVFPGSGANEFTVTVVEGGGASVSQSVPLNFVVGNVVGGTATLMDMVRGELVINESLTAGQGPWARIVTDPKGFFCFPSRSEYESGGGNRHVDNEAVLIAGDLKLPATAVISYRCEAAFVDVVKMTNGVPNPKFAWTFPFYNGPDGYTSDAINLIGGVDSLSDPEGDGLLPLKTALNPTRTYTICETQILAGYSAHWQLNGELLLPYNPDSDNLPPEDLGNRCVDFGAGTNIPLSAGATITFEIDNRSETTTGGGDPRTPGYWKNWSRCTGGGQAANADRQAVRSGYSEGEGWRVGFWLLEDVLNPSIGGGILWDDIQADALQVPIASCEQAYEILDMRQVTANSVVGDGKKLASDGARTLARHLLAAQLNFAARACTTQAALDASAAGELLLDSINFDGTRSTVYLKSGAVYAEALRLAAILDAYNNGAFCGSLLPH
jgi:hypothetical protein